MTPYVDQIVSIRIVPDFRDFGIAARWAALSLKVMSEHLVALRAFNAAAARFGV